jgi:hypothetical protein
LYFILNFEATPAHVYIAKISFTSNNHAATCFQTYKWVYLMLNGIMQKLDPMQETKYTAKGWLRVPCYMLESERHTKLHHSVLLRLSNQNM